MIKVYIDSQKVKFVNNSLNISNAIESRATCQFRVFDDTGTEEYTKGQPIEIYDDDELKFSGVVLRSTITRASPKGDRFHNIKASNYHYASDKRLATKVYQNEKTNDIVTDLWDSYLKDEGVKISELWQDYQEQEWGEL